MSEHNIPGFYNIQAPANTRLRNPRKVVFGFPIPNEWLESQYEAELKAQHDAGVTTFGGYHDRIMNEIQVCRDLVTKCQEICQDGPWIRVVIAETSGYGRGRVSFLVVGKHGHGPSPETLESLHVTMFRQKIYENPGWYPRLE